MPFKKLLVPVTGRACDAVALKTALDAAKSFDAHVVALFVHADAREAIPFGEMPLSPDFVQNLIETTAGIEKSQLAAARAALEKAAADAHAPLHPGVQTGYGASLAETAGPLAQELVGAARFCDLMVFPAIGKAASPELTDAFARVLIKTACPLLLAPVSPPAEIGRRIVAAWDGGGAAARSLKSSLPWLQQAQTVEIVSVCADTTPDETDKDLIAYLALHGIAAKRRTVPQGARKMGEALLAAAEGACDLLIAGGYSHGRLSETLFGGVTEHLLAHAKMPVLMTH